MHASIKPCKWLQAGGCQPLARLLLWMCSALPCSKLVVLHAFLMCGKRLSFTAMTPHDPASRHMICHAGRLYDGGD